MANVQIKDISVEQTTLNATDWFELQEAAGTSKKTKLSTLLLAMHPIGESYTQHYGDPLPSTLYGGTWTLRFNDEAIVEMTESSGGATWEAETFDANVKDSQTQGHKHGVYDGVNRATTSGGSVNGSGANVAIESSGPLSDGVNGTPRVGLATKSRRRIVRKFTRTA
jgi:hypothetical protein